MAIIWYFLARRRLVTSISSAESPIEDIPFVIWLLFPLLSATGIEEPPLGSYLVSIGAI